MTWLLGLDAVLAIALVAVTAWRTRDPRQTIWMAIGTAIFYAVIAWLQRGASGALPSLLFALFTAVQIWRTFRHPASLRDQYARSHRMRTSDVAVDEAGRDAS